MKDCPWVDDELRVIADRLQALAGASLGAMGDRFDDSLRALVMERCEVVPRGAGEAVLSFGEAVDGMYVVGAGRAELVDDTGAVTDELGPGAFLFPAQVLAGGAAPSTARAGAGGALFLKARRAVAHELMLSVPPLIEILAG
jgi:CRP-like cAMP-binding protein